MDQSGTLKMARILSLRSSCTGVCRHTFLHLTFDFLSAQMHMCACLSAFPEWLFRCVLESAPYTPRPHTLLPVQRERQVAKCAKPEPSVGSSNLLLCVTMVLKVVRDSSRGCKGLRARARGRFVAHRDGWRVGERRDEAVKSRASGSRRQSSFFEIDCGPIDRPMKSER